MSNQVSWNLQIQITDGRRGDFEALMSMVAPVGISVYGEPSDEVKAALAGFAPAYLGTFGGFRR